VADHRYLEKRWVDSAKVSRCIELLQQIEKNDRAEKTIIFSQFTSLLDLLEVPLRKTGIQYQRYDGGMSASKRNQAIIDFQEDENLKVLLVSIKAGNSGLNLVAASQVIIMGMLLC
jgi:SNF2 family DNA or RNA helicase